MHPQPLIAVRDVEASSRWYQRLLGCQSAHGGSEYERPTVEGELILQSHAWTVEHHHGAIGDAEARPYGNGVLLWFEVEDFDAAVSGRSAGTRRGGLWRPRGLDGLDALDALDALDPLATVAAVAVAGRHALSAGGARDHRGAAEQPGRSLG